MGRNRSSGLRTISLSSLTGKIFLCVYNLMQTFRKKFLNATFVYKHLWLIRKDFVEQGWRSGESARAPTNVVWAWSRPGTICVLSLMFVLSLLRRRVSLPLRKPHLQWKSLVVFDQAQAGSSEALCGLFMCGFYFKNFSISELQNTLQNGIKLSWFFLFPLSI